MNRVIRRLAIGLLLCYVVLFVQLNVLQVGKRDSLRADVRNNRESVRTFDAPRGPIVTSDGVVVADTAEIPVEQRTAGGYRYQREYPTKELFANVSGYYTYAYGSTQLEHLYGDVLAGDTPKQQMLAVGRALVVNPSLLLLDEPLEGLAPIIVQELLAAIRHITREEGLSTIIVEQHPDLVLAMTDEAVVLERGQIVHRERASTLRTQPDLLQRLMGVE